MSPTRDARPTTRTVKEEIEIAAPVEAVWRALTDAEELARWFPLEARVTPGNGGKVWLRWDDVYEWEQRIEIWEPNRHLRTGYVQSAGERPRAEADPKAALPPIQLAIDFELEARGGTTILRVVHSGFGADAAWDHEYGGVMRGWRYELRSLRHYLERHPGVARKVVWVRKVVKLTAEEAWQYIMSPDGFLGSGSLADLHPGSEYTLRTAAGDLFHGVVQTVAPPFEFSATVVNLGDALIRVSVDLFQLEPMVGLWLATYGLSQTQLDGISLQLRALLDRAFPGSSP